MKKKTADISLRDAIMSDEPDMIKGDYTVDKKALADYLKAQEKLVALQKQGKLMIEEVEDEEKPNILHCIYVKPIWDDIDDLEISAKELAGVLKLMDTMTVSKGDYTIQLSKKIFSKAKVE